MKKSLTIFLQGLMVIALLFSAMESYADSQRMILAEEATNASCGPCAAYNPYYQQIVQDNFDIVIPLVYHWDFPGPNDPMFLEDVAMNNGRIESYYGINGVPHYILDGTRRGNPGNIISSESGYVSGMRGVMSPIDLTITETRNGNDVTVDVDVASSSALSGKKLRIAVVEYILNYPNGSAGSNGEEEFFWVARKMLPSHQGVDVNISAGGSETFTQNFTMKSSYDASQIYIVAFIQDDNTREVLQAATSLSMTKVTMSVDNPFLTIPASDQLTKTITVTNPGNAALDVNFNVDTEGSYLPSGWQATVAPASANIAAGGTTDITLTINSPANAGFVFAAVKAVPQVSEGISVSGTSVVYALSEATKNAFFIGTHEAPQLMYNSLVKLTEYSTNTAMIPLSSEVLNAYPAAQYFDMAVFTIDYWSRGQIGGAVAINTQLVNSINSMISAGKNILITSELDLIVSEGTSKTALGEAFFKNVLGISTNGSPVMRITTNSQGQITGVNQYPVTGVKDDPIGDGITFIANQYDQTTHPYYGIYTDIIKVNSGSDAVPFMYYDHDQSKIGGVHVENGDAKIVFMTTGFEAYSNAQNRNTLMERIINWFNTTTTTDGPMISSDTEDIDFGKVDLGSDATQTITITNTGDEELNISEISVLDDEVFVLENLPFLPLYVEPQGTIEFDVKFVPTVAENYTDEIIITSNAKNDTQFGIALAGEGVGGSSVKDGVYMTDGFSINAGPNPFVENTVVRYTVSGDAERHVNITVVDPTGRTIATLVNETKTVGEYTVDFNGAGFAAGTYFIISRVDGKTIQLPVALVK